MTKKNLDDMAAQECDAALKELARAVQRQAAALGLGELTMALLVGNPDAAVHYVSNASREQAAHAMRGLLAKWAGDGSIDTDAPPEDAAQLIGGGGAVPARVLGQMGDADRVAVLEVISTALTSFCTLMGITGARFTVSLIQEGHRGAFHFGTTDRDTEESLCRGHLRALEREAREARGVPPLQPPFALPRHPGKKGGGSDVH